MTSAGTSWITVGVFLWQSGTLALMCVTPFLDCQNVIFSAVVLNGTFDICFQAVSAKVVRDVCTKYIYDKCPAVAAVGAFFAFADCFSVCSDSKSLSSVILLVLIFRLASFQQVPLSSCQTTTECAVLCTGWGFEMSCVVPSVRYFPPVSRLGTIFLPPLLQEFKPDLSRWRQEQTDSHRPLSLPLLPLGYHSYLDLRG